MADRVNPYEEVPDTTSPGELILRIPCGPAFKSNLISAMRIYGSQLLNGPSRDVVIRLIAAARAAEYKS